MKKHSTLVVFLLLMLCAMTAQAQGLKFPDFNPGKIEFKIPAFLPGMVNDSLHLKNDSFRYNYKGIIFKGRDGHIPDKIDGFTGKGNMSTPWQTLAEALYNYQNRDFENVQKLYTKSSRPMMDEMLKGTRKDSFITMMAGIKEINVLSIFDYADGMVAIVDMKGLAINPVYFVKQKKKYYLSSLVDKDRSAWNIAMYLNYAPLPFISPQIQAVPDTIVAEDTAVTMSFRLSKPGDYLVMGPATPGQSIIYLCKDNSPLDLDTRPGSVKIEMTAYYMRHAGIVPLFAVESNVPVMKVYNSMINGGKKFQVFVKKSR